MSRPASRPEHARTTNRPADTQRKASALRATIRHERGEMAMHGKIIHVIRRAESTVLASIVDFLTREGESFFRANALVSETFTGDVASGKRMIIFVPYHGKETNKLEVGARYLLFLRSKPLSPPNDSVLWSLVDGTSPLLVEESQVSDVSIGLRGYARVGVDNVAEREIRQHLIQMLQSNVGFFRVDASRTVADYSGWEEAEIDALASRITGEDGFTALSGNESDNVISAIVGRAERERATSFSSIQLKRGAADPVYFGLLLRKDGSAETITRRLLQSSDPDVQIGALRVAGLMEQAQMIKEFEERHGKSANAAVRNAITAAKELLDRN